jgi:hypothetical protein
LGYEKGSVVDGVSLCIGADPASDKRDGALDGVPVIHRALARGASAPTVKNGKMHLSNY